MEAIRKISTLGMSKEEWLNHRKDGIGCSETGTILGLNPYQSSLELFYHKLGEVGEFEGNIATWMGTYLEDRIADLYQYWETDQETMIKNYDSDNKINTIRRINAILTNARYPWLLGDLDREQTKPYKAVVEVKTVSSFALEHWEGGIPPAYIAQCQAYMMITGHDLCKLVILKNGRYLEVYDIEANEKFQGYIAEMCEAFWQKVIAAKILKEQNKPFESLEPEPDGSDAYEKFLKEKFKSKPVTIDGTADQFESAKLYMKYCDEIKDITDKKQYHKNVLMNAMREAEKISFGLGGYISWKENAKGTRVFNCKIKPIKERAA